MKIFSNHSKICFSVTSDLELTKNKLVINMVSATPADLWRLPRPVSSEKCQKHRFDTFSQEAPQRGSEISVDMDDLFVFCQFEVACHAGNKFGVI